MISLRNVALAVCVCVAFFAMPATGLVAVGSNKPSLGAPLPINSRNRVMEVCRFDDSASSASNVFGAYAKKHAELRKKGRVLIYVAGEGLGSRLRGVSVAFLLSIATNRALLIQWGGLANVLQPNFIDWSGNETERRLAHQIGHVVMGDPRMTGLLKEANLATTGGMPASWGEDPPLADLVVLPHLLVADLPDKPLRELFPSTFEQLAPERRDAMSFLGCASRYLFRLAPSFSSSLNAAMPRLSHPEFGIQLRFGDVAAYNLYGTTVHGEDDTRMLPEERIVRKVLQCAKGSQALMASRLFTSDWADARRIAADPRNNVTVLGGAPVHLELTLGGSGAQKTAQAQDLWTEFFLLSGSDALLVSGSRATTQESFTDALFNKSGTPYTCRASFFGMGAAAVGLLASDHIAYTYEDCAIGCGMA